MTIKLKILPVFQGDAIVIDCMQDNFKIIVDMGTKRAYSRGILKSEIEREDKFDLLVLTHTDEDHIGGLIKYFDDQERKNNVFKNIWFNSGRIIQENLIVNGKSSPEFFLDNAEILELSIKQGISLEQKLNNANLTPFELIKSGNNYQFENVNINILSPDADVLKNFYNEWELETEKGLELAVAFDYHKSIKELLEVKYLENGTLANKTSIAFILNFKNNNILLMGDAYPSIIEKNLRNSGYNENNKLKLDVIKVSHHGSSYGISPNLLEILDCTNFVISTNGSNGLPVKECLARIVAHRKEKVFLYFNYKNDITENIFSQQDFDIYNFEVRFLTLENNYTITISE